MPRTLLLLLLIIKLSACQRRITNSSSIDYGADTTFVVYIVKAVNYSPGWLCGGCIIHPSLILTSASCLETGPKQMYVVPGYTKYVNTENIMVDNCTRNMHKKIYSYCLHKYFSTKDGATSTSSERKYKWTKYDIGIARTDTPIDFYESDWSKYCSYMPTAVNINYNPKYEENYAQVVAFGWGHANYYRPEGDVTDYNSPELRYTSSIILPRKTCQTYFTNEYIQERIGRNFLCTNGEDGNFNAAGRHTTHTEPVRDKCDLDYDRRSGWDLNDTETRRSNCFTKSNSNKTDTNIYKLNATYRNIKFIGNARRHGICQNDHGNPLILWIGGKPYVVGVASAFQVNKKMQCVGPFLFTSVSCTSLFVHCIMLQQNTLKTRRAPSYCDHPGIIKGFEIEETEIDWSIEDF